MTKVTVRERSSTTTKGPFWKDVFLSPGFQDLADRKILWAKIGKHENWTIGAGGYVGRALLGDFELEVREKVPGAFAAMAQILTPRAFNLARAQSPVIFAETPHTVLVRMFLAATRTYLSGAKQVEYQALEETGAYACGRLNVPRTAALRARGIRHKVAFRRTLLSDDLPLNRAIYLALADVILVFRSGSLRELVADALTLRAGFAECGTSMNSFNRVEAIAVALEEAVQSGRRREVCEVAALAGAVLQAATLSDDRPHDGASPRSWFLNLENLFERVVRECVVKALVGRAQVSGPIERPPLFSTIPDRFRANPDVVVRCAGETWILDAKYKTLDDWPSTGDVHELLAHSAAFNASKAALVYPSDSTFSVRSLGKAKTGCEVWVFTIPFTDISPAIFTILRELGLPVPMGLPVAA